MKVFKPLSVDSYPKSDFCDMGKNLLSNRKLENIQEHITSTSPKWLNQAFTLQRKQSLCPK